MTPDLIVLGGWYADNRPDRTYAATIWHSNHTYTHWGVLPNPPGDAPLWLAISVSGNRIAAQGQHDPPKGWEFDGTQWNPTEAPCGVWPVIYDALDVLHISHCQPGVGSQGWRYVAPDGQLVTGDSTIAVRHGLNERTDLSLAQDGSFMVGQCHSGAGVGVWIGGVLRVLSPGSCFNVRGKWDIVTNTVSVSCYNVAHDGVESRLFWTTPEALLALPPEVEPAPPVTFRFSHPVSVYPFKAAGSGCPDLFTLGTYTEGAPDQLPTGRLLLAHDGPDDWAIPTSALRPYDLVLWELYRLPSETLAQSADRWIRQTRANLAQWRHDCGVIPMFYCQGGIPGGNPPEVWTVAEVLDGLRYLDIIVNLDRRLKVIAPFAYNRANGIVAHPELQEAFRSLVAAADRAGHAILTPVTPPEPEQYQAIKSY